ncbi:MAG: phasin family protein [Anaerolineae bacterium]|uniref:phasin family protein n=1 Tax=Candidatus Amarolinea dominans TaxID=3140696 RepID=UPI001D39098B|nr:phasin family protein [Anaerolineae bacterium]MBK7201521.1 phasin family protein [Anaerolineae bacterium]MBK9092526.1 phasin family protein [Anaerolineae bacterium]MBK9231513.1 phasin family protein [Anaerolineae bacterium]
MAQKKIAEQAEQAVEVVKTEIAETAEKATPLFETVHRVLLAGVGAVALTTDEIQDFVDRLVERGEIAERDGRKLVKDVISRRNGAEKQVEKSVENASNMVEDQIEKILNRLNVPTKHDIEELGKKIAHLTKKVDDLKKSTA